MEESLLNNHISQKEAIHDVQYNKLVTDFLNNSGINTDFLSSILTAFYYECKKDSNLVSTKDNTLLINKITLNHVMNFQFEIESKVTNKKITTSNGYYILDIIQKFCKYLTAENIVKIYYKSPSLISYKKEVERKIEYPILTNFEEYLSDKQYKHLIHFTNSVLNFLKSSDFKIEQVFDNQFWEKSIEKYEEILRKKVQREVISSATAYNHLTRIKVFSHFLYEKKFITFIYKIPQNMISHSKRSNEYVRVEDILLVIDKILETSHDTLRDLCLILILIETGCRPIEIENLTLNDMNIKAKTIKLRCTKSPERTLKLSETTVTIIKDYLIIRKNYLPDEDNISFFLSSKKIPLNTKKIYKILRKFILKTFGEMRFTPKTLRHTLITNALDNKVNINEVAKIVGHKYIKSTFHYYFRSKNRIKKISISNNLKLLEELHNGN